MSPSLKRLTNIFSWKDSYRVLHPNDISFSRYYENKNQDMGATRIDINYHYGELQIVEAKYVGNSFSDHLALIVSFKLPSVLPKIQSPKSRPLFKIKPEVVSDQLSQQMLKG